MELVFNFRRIDGNIDTAGLLNAGQLAQLGAAGYQAVINLLPVETEYAVREEADIVAAQGIEYVYIPVDFSAPAEADLQAFTAALQARRGRRLLLHCAANFRVSAFFAIYACRELGWSGAAARAHIASLWEPADYPPWQEFIDARLPAAGA